MKIKDGRTLLLIQEGAIVVNHETVNTILTSLVSRISLRHEIRQPLHIKGKNMLHPSFVQLDNPAHASYDVIQQYRASHLGKGWGRCTATANV